MPRLGRFSQNRSQIGSLKILFKFIFLLYIVLSYLVQLLNAFYIPDPGPPTNIVLRQISNRRVQATWTARAGFSGATYRVFINTDMVNTGGTDINDGTTFITSASYTTGFTVTFRIRATTGTYYSVPAVSETFTVRGEALQVQYWITISHYACLLLYIIIIYCHSIFNLVSDYPIVYLY